MFKTPISTNVNKVIYLSLNRQEISMLTIINKIRNRKINSSSDMNTFLFLIRKNKKKSNHID
jgi:hypothetical protein